MVVVLHKRRAKSQGLTSGGQSTEASVKMETQTKTSWVLRTEHCLPIVSSLSTGPECEAIFFSLANTVCTAGVPITGFPSADHFLSREG